MRVCMHAGAGIAEWDCSTIAGYFPRVVAEPAEVVRADHQAHGILRSYAGYGGNYGEIRVSSPSDSIRDAILLSTFSISLFNSETICRPLWEIIVLTDDFSMVSLFSPLRTWKLHLCLTIICLWGNSSLGCISDSLSGSYMAALSWLRIAYSAVIEASARSDFSLRIPEESLTLLAFSGHASNPLP